MDKNSRKKENNLTDISKLRFITTMDMNISTDSKNPKNRVFLKNNKSAVIICDIPKNRLKIGAIPKVDQNRMSLSKKPRGVYNKFV